MRVPELNLDLEIGEWNCRRIEDNIYEIYSEELENALQDYLCFHISSVLLFTDDSPSLSVKIDNAFADPDLLEDLILIPVSFSGFTKEK